MTEINLRTLAEREAEIARLARDEPPAVSDLEHVLSVMYDWADAGRQFTVAIFRTWDGVTVEIYEPLPPPGLSTHPYVSLFSFNDPE